MKGDEDLHANDAAMMKKGERENEEREICWLETQEDDLLNQVNDPSTMFYGDNFPPLPDFPCMSSSSSSSSTPAPPLKGIINSSSTSSSSSSSSSSSASSSSAASWAVLKSDDAEHPSLLSTASMDKMTLPPLSQPSDLIGDNGDNDIACMDVLETFEYMDLIEENNDMIWDPSSIFDENDQPQIVFEDQQPPPPTNEHPHQQQQQQQQIIGGVEKVEGSTSSSEDLAMMFFEWLKMNREMVSAEDLRNIKIKRSTIENAAKRLGTGKDGMKRLVKLVLEWVQNHQLQAKQKQQQQIITEDIRPPPQVQVSVLPSFANQQLQQESIFQNPNPNPNNPNFINSANSLPPPNHQWIAQPQAVTTAIGYPPPPPSMVGIGNMTYHDPFPPTEFHPPHPMMNSTASQPQPPWPSQQPQPLPPQLQPQPSFPPQYIMPSHYNSFSENNNLLPLHSQPLPTAFGNGYGNQCTYQYFPGNGEKLVRLGSSATKEARQKRMAKNRRVLHHHRHHHHQQQNHNNQQNQHQMNQTIADQQQASVFIGSENSVTDQAQAANPANWVYWSSPPPAAPSASTSAPMALPVDTTAVQPQVQVQVQANQSDRPSQNYQRQIASEKRQGWKPEKNLRFLLQKVLKQSDVGNLGRIVLPKKEAETHLPELDARDGISIPMEDIGTSRVWNMKYRFWPNNKSRMYLLENTGDFVKTNGLQEGDFIVIYSDMKCGKYMIRGVKVRQSGSKSEAKKSGGKSNKNQHNHGTTTKAGNHSASSPNKANSSNGSDNDGKMNQIKKNKLASSSSSSSSSFINLKLEAQWCG